MTRIHVKPRRSKLDMCPCLTPDNQPDGAFVDSELGGDLGVSHTRRHCSDLRDSIFGQAGEAICATGPTLKPWHTPAFNRIARVVLDRPCVEVFRSHARRIVAMVADKAALRNRAEVEFVRETMGICVSAIDRQASVALADGVPCPQPALVGFVNGCPEAIRRSTVPVSEEAFSRTVLAVAGRAWANVTLERFAAMQADAS